MTLNNISLNLLENAMDFIIRGLDELYELDDDTYEYERYILPISKPQKDYKYGILHLFSGFLLLLKEKLWRYSPELIFTTEPKTVNYTEAKKRLRGIEPPVIFTSSDLCVIDKIQDYRNCFEHYKVSNLDLSELNEVIISFIDVIYRFLVEHLEIDIVSSSFNTDPKTIVKIMSIEVIYTHMTEKRKSDLIALGNEKVETFKTVRKRILEKLNEENEIYYDETCEGDYAFGDCPKCNESTLIIRDEEFKGVCFNKKCYSFIPLKNCSKCGAIMSGYDWIEEWCSFCEDEAQMIMERDRFI